MIKIKMTKKEEEAEYIHNMQEDAYYAQQDEADFNALMSSSPYMRKQYGVRKK